MMNNIGSKTTQCSKYRVKPNALKCTSRYNYIDMNVTTKTMLEGFSKNLTALRTAKGVSAREMSLFLGQCAGYINDIENGRTMPSLVMLFEICEYLQISPEQFFAYTNNNADKTKSAALLDAINSLSAEDQKMLINIAERMRK